LEVAVTYKGRYQRCKRTMEVKTGKIVVWCGATPNQKALVNKIAKLFPVGGIVIDLKTGTGKKRSLTELPGLIINRLRFHEINNAWQKMLSFYAKNYPSWPDVPVFRTDQINTDESVLFTEQFSPNLVVVSGTSLIRKPLLNVKPSTGIINLHTGLSPYVKGGPNCTNWCIANNTWEYVGNTIMWLNAGIDSGNIISTEAIDIRASETLYEAHLKVMEHAHDLYLRSIDYLINSKPPYLSVPQNEIAPGHLFLNKMWTAEKKSQLLKNWKLRKQAPLVEPPPATVPLPPQFRIKNS
jgi:folate-dependent phosphoribosylglycinamide formyltransferase PurN